MTLEPLLHAPLAVQIHVAAVLPAAFLGAYILAARGKGSPRHRLFGKVWLVLMVITAVSSFFIHSLNVWHGFSPLHLLSLLTLFGCVQAYRSARRGQIAMHKRIVASLYLGGIVVAGGFTLLPHRIMHVVLIDGSAMSFALLVGTGALLLYALVRSSAGVLRRVHHEN